MANYNSKNWRFEIYTYFGRVLETFKIPDDELHHHALRRATEFADKQSCPTWIRLKTT